MVSGSVIRQCELVLATITGVSEHGISVTCMETTTWSCFSSTGTVTFSWSANNTVFLVFDDCINMLTSRECDGMSLYCAEKYLGCIGQ